MPVPPLRAVRQAQGLGLREVARRARVDHAQLSKVERGQESLSLAALQRVARVLELNTLADLLGQYIPADDGGGEAIEDADGRTRESALNS
jgi:transcriptional regulator with XRE-family HTH domain